MPLADDGRGQVALCPRADETQTRESVAGERRPVERGERGTPKHGDPRPLLREPPLPRPGLLQDSPTRRAAESP